MIILLILGILCIIAGAGLAVLAFLPDWHTLVNRQAVPSNEEEAELSGEGETGLSDEGESVVEAEDSGISEK